MLHASIPGATNADKQALHIGAVACIHRFGFSLKGHVHFHVCAVDGVFEKEVTDQGDTDAHAPVRAPRVIFHPANGVNVDAVGQVQTTLRKRILRAFVGRGLLVGFEAKEMLAYKHRGFSVDTSVCISAQRYGSLVSHYPCVCATTGGPRFVWYKFIANGRAPLWTPSHAGARIDSRCRTERRAASGYEQRDTDRDRQETRLWNI
jgi:hypothetical protein